jgi:3-oxoadipate enol-lactonase
MTDDGCRLSVTIDGPSSGPPLVLSNSLGTDFHLWDGQLEALSGRHRVVRYDMRGHGASDVPAGDYTIERLGRDVLSVMDSHGIGRAALAGISIGGIVSLWVATHAPDRVERLVLANTAAKIGNEALWKERVRVVREDGLSQLADATMVRWFTERFRQQHPEIVARFHQTVARTNPDGYVGCCAALRDADLRPLAATVAVPTLVIVGTHDVATTAADGYWLADAIPGTRLVELDAAHLSNVERVEAFNEAVRTFLHD